MKKEQKIIEAELERENLIYLKQREAFLAEQLERSNQSQSMVGRRTTNSYADLTKVDDSSCCQTKEVIQFVGLFLLYNILVMANSGREAKALPGADPSPIITLIIKTYCRHQCPSMTGNFSISFNDSPHQFVNEIFMF